MTSINHRELFFNYVAQTSPNPLAKEIVKANGMYLYDIDGNKILDLIAGISVSNIGHCNPLVIKAIEEQISKYMHIMVYGEMIQSPQTLLAEKIVSLLPKTLNNVYFVNSGSEAIEGALKLAKRCTGRRKIIAFNKAYHGSTHGALSVMGCESYKQAFKPLLSDIQFLDFNNLEQLKYIDSNTACVIAETIQGEAGVRVPDYNYMQALRQKCSSVGSLLILDEIQTGFGRTGKFFAFEHYNIVPDILCIAKGMGGGMPIGAFIADKTLMEKFTTNPVLGHITTFGGHPVCCAAALANINYILDNNLVENALKIENIFIKHLKHPLIKEIRSKGLLMAIEFENATICHSIINNCLEKNMLTDWFLFADNCLRIAPPLIISVDEAIHACQIILATANKVLNEK